MDILADIEALQAELDTIVTEPTKEDRAALVEEQKKVKAAADKARGTRKEKPAPVELDLSDTQAPEEKPKPKKTAKPKTNAVPKEATGVTAPAVKLEGLPKKVKEKALNAIKALETGSKPSKYTKLAISNLVATGGMKRGELVVFFAGTGMGKSTANAQASQMQSLLTTLGVATNEGGVLKPVLSSPFIALGK